MTEVSVIVPTRDRWSLLAPTLACALAQEDVDHEVIVVDDGSRDETPERLAALSHPRLTVLRHEASRGVSRARNRGLAEARGRMTAFLDDDDVWAPWKLRRQLDAAAEGAVLVYCDYLIVDEHRTVVRREIPPPPEHIERHLLGASVLGGPSMVMTDTEVALGLGGFDPELSALADWDMWIRLAGAGPAARSPEVLAAYLLHPGGMLAHRVPDTWAEFLHLAAKHRARAEELGVVANAQGLAITLAHAQARGGQRRRGAARALGAAIRHRRPRHAVLGLALLGGEPLAFRLRRRRWDPPAAPDWLERTPSMDEGVRLDGVGLAAAQTVPAQS